MTEAEIHKVYAGVIGIIVCVGATWGFMEHERHVGERALLTRQTDSVRVEASAKAAIDSVAKVVLMQQAATLESAARKEVAKDAALAKADSEAHRIAAVERERAVALLRDSLATSDSLRREIGRLVASGTAEAKADSVKEVQHQVTVRGLLATIDAKNAALRGDSVAYGSLLLAKQAGEREIALLKKAQPSTVGNIVRAAAFTLAGLGAGRLLR